MKIIFPFLLSCLAVVPAYAHHGPFELREGETNHSLHLGIVLTPDKGQVSGKNAFSVRACHLQEIDFVRRSGDPRNRKLIPFKLQTNRIVAYGLAGEGSMGFNSANAAGVALSGIFTLNPFALPMAFLSSGGGQLWHYSLVSINPENGRLVQRIMSFYSEKDVRYINEYLKLATGLDPNEQMREDEIKALHEKIMNNLSSGDYSVDRAECPYFEKFGKPLPPKKVREGNTSGRSRGT